MQQPRPSLGVPTHPQLLYTAKGHTQKRCGLSLEGETAHTDRAGLLHKAGRAQVVLCQQPRPDVKGARGWSCQPVTVVWHHSLTWAVPQL